MSKLPLKCNFKKSSKLNRFHRFRSINNVRDAKNADNDLVIIQGCLESGRKLKILIDNGSQAELISRKTALELGKSIRHSNSRLVSAQGSDMQVIGEVDLNLSIAGHNTSVTVQVVENLSTKYDVILGLSWLNQNNTSFVTQPGRTPIFKIDSTEIPIITNINRDGLKTVNVSNLSNSIIDFAKCASNLKIAPRSVGFLKLGIPYNEKLLGQNMIYFEQLEHTKEGTDEFGDNPGPGPLFKLQPGVIKIKLSGNNRIYCHIPYSNLSEETIFLKKGRVVGSLSLVEEVTLVYNSDNEEKVTEGKPDPHIITNSVNSATVDDTHESQKDYSDPDIRNKYIRELIAGKCDDTETQHLLEQLFIKYPKLVKCPNEILGFTTEIEHEILYNGPQCIYIPPYKSSNAEQTEINAEVLKMLSEDLIETSKSGFNLPILVVRKKMGQYGYAMTAASCQNMS